MELQAYADSSRISLEYQPDGRVHKIVYQIRNDPPFVFFNISYAASEIILARPIADNPEYYTSDTIHLFMDGDKLLKRIQFRLDRQKSAPNPQWTYAYDTTIYQYNNDGLLTKELHSSHDSTWFIWHVDQSEITQVTRNNEVTDHTIANRNLVSIKSISNNDLVEYRNGGISYSNSSEETILTFEYNKKFHNKTDFSNAAVLNEIDLFSLLPMNRNYRYLPDKVDFSTLYKNQNGEGYWTVGGSATYQFDYNFLGFVTGKVEKDPQMKYTYLY